MIEPILAEDSHDTAVFHLSVFYDQIEEELARGRQVVDRRAMVVANGVCDREKRSRIEPPAYVVGTGVEKQRLGRNIKYMILHLLQRADSGDFKPGRRVAQHEISKSEITHNRLSEIDRQLL